MRVTATHSTQDGSLNEGGAKDSSHMFRSSSVFVMSIMHNTPKSGEGVR